VAQTYVDFIQKQNVDVFMYTDDNDFNHNNTQYFSDNNTGKIMGIPMLYERRYYSKQEFIDHQSAVGIIEHSLNLLFGKSLKGLHVEKYRNDLMKDIYLNDNRNHQIFMTNPHACVERKIALMSQFYKLYKCFQLMEEYERKEGFLYDIVIKSRFDGVLNLNDMKSLDLTNKVYCEGYPEFMNDWWAIGNRYIMEKYCKYYLNISPNISNNTYIFKKGGRWNTVISETDPRDNSMREDASDSGEVGLTYLIRTLEKYETFYNHTMRIDLSYKFYS
jgi:hypothetical protein